MRSRLVACLALILSACTFADGAAIPLSGPRAYLPCLRGSDPQWQEWAICTRFETYASDDGIVRSTYAGYVCIDLALEETAAMNILRYRNICVGPCSVVVDSIACFPAARPANGDL